MKTNRNLVEEAMIDYWGKRCGEYEEECSCCEAWKQYDRLIDKDKKLKGKQKQ